MRTFYEKRVKGGTFGSHADLAQMSPGIQKLSAAVQLSQT